MLNISRHSLIFGLSYALDIMGRNNLSHSKSTAYLAVMLAREIGISEEETLNIYYAALLHDIGLSDEYTLGHADIKNMKRHCFIGERMLKKLPLPEIIPNYIRCHHEYFNGSGAFELAGEDIPQGSQVIGLASDFDDAFGKTEGYDRYLILKVYDWLDGKKTLFSEDIVKAFSRLINREYYLLDYFNHETKYTLSNKIFVNDDVYYSGEDIVIFARCFADIIDQRSPFTFRHSTGIAELALKAVAHLGYDECTQNKMYVAGLLHDIGKLHVSTEILHKKGSLSLAERFEINKHTYFTRKILEQIQGLEGIVDIAANHHERLDGAGYPYHLESNQLSELERVMAVCDVYQALREERPYRESLPPEKAWAIIDEMTARKHLDQSLVEKIKLAFS